MKNSSQWLKDHWFISLLKGWGHKMPLWAAKPHFSWRWYKGISGEFPFARWSACRWSKTKTRTQLYLGL